MKLLVGTTPVRLSVNGAPVVQNLGPGVLYMDVGSDVSQSTGIQIPVNQAYEFVKRIGLASGSLYLVATQSNTDVRILEVG